MLDQLINSESFLVLNSQQSAIIRRRVSNEDVILSEVQQRLNSSGHEELRSLAYEYHEGMLILRGRLSSHYLKQLAQEAVRTQLGVRMIVNAIEVVPPRLQAPSQDKSE